MILDQSPHAPVDASNLAQILEFRASTQPENRAFTFLVDGEADEIVVTYRELDRQARAIAAKLQTLFTVGDRALLLYAPGLDYVAALFGCFYAGIVAVPAYPPRRNRNMLRLSLIAADCDARIALTTRTTYEVIKPQLKESQELLRLTWIQSDVVESSLADTWIEPELRQESLAALQYTSGSTGRPKGVVLTHANLLHNSRLIASAFEHPAGGSGLTWLPVYHDMGLIGGILQPIYSGFTNVLMSPMAFLQKPFRWLSAISRYRSSISGGPNFAYELCVQKITREQCERIDLSKWTLAFNGAEPIRAETLRAFNRKFAPCGFRPEAFYPCYGLAEATLMVSGGQRTLPPTIRRFDGRKLEQHLVVDASSEDESTRELVSCGRNLPGQRIFITDHEKQTGLPDGHIGEVWLQGPSVAQGYWNKSNSTQQIFQAYHHETGEGPFLRTGDLGFVNNGELYITGRLKDLIIVRGRNHYPQDIEQVVSQCHPQIRAGQSAAFLVDVDGCERLGIVAETERERHLDCEAIFSEIRRQILEEFDLPVESITLLRAGSIPKTSSGKIQRHACKQGLIEGGLKSIAQWIAPRVPLSNFASVPLFESPFCEGLSIHAAVDVNRPKQIQQDLDILRPPQLVEEILDHVRKVAKDRSVIVTLDTSMSELGLDSLERMEVLASLNQTFGDCVPADTLAQVDTCRELVYEINHLLQIAVKSPQPAASLGIDEHREIQEEDYRVEQFPEVLELQKIIAQTVSNGVPSPYLKVHEGILSDTTCIDGRRLINFSSFNYLGMSGDRRVMDAAKRAIYKFGTSAGASRLVSGDKTIHRELENELAEFLGIGATMVLPSGHSTNESAIGHLLRPGDLVLHDALIHNSIQQGAILSGAQRRAFPHNNWEACDRLLSDLRPGYRRVLVAIEGVYSMDGDFPDLRRFVEIKKRHKALLYIDMAHCLGVLGQNGRGIMEHWEVNPSEIDIVMGTISKALGSCGGFIGGTHSFIEYLKYTLPAFVFATGISPSAAAAALESVRLLRAEPQRVQRMHERADLFLSLAQARGMNTGSSGNTAVIPIILGNSRDCMLASHQMFEQGVNVQPIVYPAVEENAARLRFFITSDHTEEQIFYAVDVLREILDAINPLYVSH